jgi:hypothetical protein
MLGATGLDWFDEAAFNKILNPLDEGESGADFTNEILATEIKEGFALAASQAGFDTSSLYKEGDQLKSGQEFVDAAKNILSVYKA